MKNAQRDPENNQRKEEAVACRKPAHTAATPRPSARISVIISKRTRVSQPSHSLVLVLCSMIRSQRPCAPGRYVSEKKVGLQDFL